MTLTRRHGLMILALVACAAAIEVWMGRLPLGPDGTFGWWEPDIWSAHQSQRVLDPYAVSHIVHGFLFYALLHLAMPKRPIEWRLVGAVALEAFWEVMENSPIIIDRYRAVTIAQGYIGDSIMNSMSDVVMAALGFWLAWRLPVRTSLALVVIAEVGMALLIRDNLTLNIVMLAFPIDAIKEWQMAAAPLHLR